MSKYTLAVDGWAVTFGTTRLLRRILRGIRLDFDFTESTNHSLSSGSGVVSIFDCRGAHV